MGVKENRKRNLQKEQEEKILKLKYIPEEYPEPSIIKQCTCRGNPETVPAFSKYSSTLHQIHELKTQRKTG